MMFAKVLVILAIACGVMAPAAAETRPLTVVSFDYPPFMEALPGEAPSGMMVELVNRVFERMGQPIKMEFYPLGRSLSLIDTPLADAFFTIKKTDERELKYLFTKEPVLTQEFVIFVRADSPLEFKGDIHVLANTTLGVVNKVSYGATFDDAARRGVFSKLEVAPSYESNFKKLLARRMDALVCSRVMGMALLKRLNAEGQARVSGPPFEITQSYLIFNRHTVDPGIAAEFDKALVALRKDGSLRKLKDKYAR